ncbi:hypothetical protein DITRI_Ditri08aG0035100 [Diplodiscus trichospermus]
MASSSFSHEVKGHDNDKAIDSLQDRVAFLKRLTGDIHDEVESHNRLLERMGSGMDATRGIMSGTMDQFKKVFEKKSNWRLCTLVVGFVASFLILYFLIRRSEMLGFDKFLLCLTSFCYAWQVSQSLAGLLPLLLWGRSPTLKSLLGVLFTASRLF